MSDPESVVTTTDKRQAFRHNCCKKIAQLGRVSYEMACQNQCRQDELDQIHKEMDQAVAELVQQHAYYSDVITKQLVRYRKERVTKACNEFGVLYKAQKTELAKKMAQKGKKVKELIAQFKEMRKSMRAATMASLKSAEHFLKRADAVEAKLKAMKESQQNSKEKPKELTELDAKIAEVEKASKEKCTQMQADHKTKMESYRRDALTSARKRLTEKRAGMTRAKERLKNARTEVPKLRAEYDKIVLARKSFAKEKSQEASKISSETSTTVADLRSQINEKMEKLWKMQEVHAEKVQEMRRQMELSNLANQNDMKALRRAISSHRKERHGSARTKRREMMKRAEEVRQNSQSAQCVFDKVLRERKEKHEQIGSSFASGVSDSERIKGDLRTSITASLGRMEAKRIEMKKRLRDQEARIKQHFAGRLSDYKAESQRECAAFEDQVGELCRGSVIVKALSVDALKDELRTLQKACAAEISQVKKKHEDEKKGMISAAQKAKTGKVADQENLIKTKLAEEKKVMAKLDQSFSKDLDSKKASLRGKAVEKLKSAKENANSGRDERQDLKESKATLTKMKAKLAAVAKSLEEQKGTDNARLEKFTSEVNLLEKQYRKFARRRKAEMQQISDDYEMKVQVEQVVLKNKIENIAKLYSADENARGKELIEAIRKVREVENLKIDAIANNRRERQQMKKEHQAVMDRLNEEIAQYKENKREKKLKAEVTALKDRIATSTRQITEKYNSLVVAVKQEIAQFQERRKVRERELAKAQEQEQKDYEEKLKEIKAQRKEVLEKKEQEKKQIQSEFDKDMTSLRTKHQKAVESLKNRIKSAKDVNAEYLAKSREERERVLANFVKRDTEECSEASKKASAEFVKIRTDIAETVKQKRSKVSDSKLKSFAPEMRRQEAELSKKAFARVKDESSYISKFKDHETSMLRIFQVKADRDAPSLLSSSHSGEFGTRGKKHLICAPSPIIS